MRLASFQHEIQASILGPVLTACDAELAIRTGPAGEHACSHYRIAIHHSHFWTRMREFVAYRYPLLQRAIGDVEFTALVRAFIAAHPPTSFTLGGVVEALPSFLAAQPSPVLADLAAFDFRRSGLRVTAEEATVSADDLAALPGDVLASTRLRLKRRAILATTQYRFEPTRIRELPRDREPTHWLVYIANASTTTRRVSPRVFAALQALGAGVTLHELGLGLRTLGFRVAECDALLDRWLAAELLVAEAA